MPPFRLTLVVAGIAAIQSRTAAKSLQQGSWFKHYIKLTLQFISMFYFSSTVDFY